LAAVCNHAFMGALRILIADRERHDDMADLFRRWGHDAQCVTDFAQAMATASFFEPDLAFLDLSLAGVGALRLRQKAGLARTCFVGLKDEFSHADPKQLRFRQCLIKPVAPLMLLEILVKSRQTLERSREQMR
jgi:DNA-binding response OmpR family regulator